MKELAALEGLPENKPVDTSANPEKNIADTLSVLEKTLYKIADERPSLIKRKEISILSTKELRPVLTDWIRRKPPELPHWRGYMTACAPMKSPNYLKISMIRCLVAIIPRMKPANAAKLLALLPPKRAASISTQLITVAGQ